MIPDKEDLHTESTTVLRKLKLDFMTVIVTYPLQVSLPLEED